MSDIEWWIEPELKGDEILVLPYPPHEPLGDSCLVPHENGKHCGTCKNCKEWVAWNEWDLGCKEGK